LIVVFTPLFRIPANILGDEFNVKTSRGTFPRTILKPIIQDGGCVEISPTDTGSRIGVVYLPTPHDQDKAEMHFIINGEDQGPCTKDIPYKEKALYAVVDVYGTTKQVRIIQLYGGECKRKCCGVAYFSESISRMIKSQKMYEMLAIDVLYDHH
jgi:neuralized-like protein 2